jgi:hypothetical protein
MSIQQRLEGAVIARTCARDERGIGVVLVSGLRP